MSILDETAFSFNPNTMKYLASILALCIAFSCQTTDTEAIKIPVSSALPIETIKDKKEPTVERVPFVNREGGFSIQFPDKPTKHQRNKESEIGSLQLTQFIYNKDDTNIWLVSYTNYPSKMIQLGNTTQLLKGIKYKVLDDLRATVNTEASVKLNDKYKGLTFSAHAKRKNLDFIYHIYLVKNRLYQISMYSSLGPIPSQDSLDFMGSFKLLDADSTSSN